MRPTNDMDEANSGWPGERDPTRLDVANANEVPEPSFLRDFKEALIARDMTRGHRHESSSSNSASRSSKSTKNTNLGHNDGDFFSTNLNYPLELISRLPNFQDSVQLVELQSAFWSLSKMFVFLREVPFPATPRDLIPPYLKFPMSCWINCLSTTGHFSAPADERDFPSKDNAGDGLFLVGLKVWGLMLEIDNREARKLDAVMASALLVSYGALTADKHLWTEASNHLGFIGAIARRLRLHESCNTADLMRAGNASDLSARTRRLLMCQLFLADVTRSLHFSTNTEFSSSELSMTMPSSSHDFQVIYTGLVLDAQQLPLDVIEQEDAMLILAAILSDVIATHRLFADFKFSPVRSPSLISNPFVPLSPFTENRRMLARLSRSLDIWGERFTAIMPEEVVSLYYFSEMYLSCPQILQLSQLAGYKPFAPSVQSQRDNDLGAINVSEEAMRCAWLVIDNVNVDRLPSRTACPIWLPVVTHTAALLVWASLHPSSTSTKSHGSMKVLSMFKSELEKMPWPCCTVMAKNLEELMGA